MVTGVSLPTPFGYNARPRGPRPWGADEAADFQVSAPSPAREAKSPPRGFFCLCATATAGLFWRVIEWALRPFLFYDDHVSHLARAAHRPHRAPRRAAGL